MAQTTKKPVSKRSKTTRKKPAAKKSLRWELKQDIIGIAMLATGFFVAFCLWQVPIQGDASILGAVGAWVYKFSVTVFGRGKWFLALALVFLGASRWFGGLVINALMLIAYSVLMLAICSVNHLLLPLTDQTFQTGWAGQGGGMIGGATVQLTNYLIGNTGSWIFFIAISLAALLVITNRTIKEVFDSAGNKAKVLAENAQNEYRHYVLRRNDKKEATASDRSIINSLNVPIDTELRKDKGLPLLSAKQAKIKNIAENKSEVGTIGIYQADDGSHEQPIIAGELATDMVLASAGLTTPVEKSALTGAAAIGVPSAVDGWWNDATESASELADRSSQSGGTEQYTLPPYSLLQIAPRIKSQRMNKDITDNVRILEETLGSFGVKAVVTQVNRGPSITRYELQPSPGVKVSKIVNLADDLALALAASHVRIEAPIPGKAAVGIEVPNTEMTTVSLREVLEDSSFKNSKSKLTFVLGKDIAGQPIVADLAKMPHLLIAGSTGSGKSVCMNALIVSLLFNAHPDEVKMMMIDPKMVELSNYNGIPHLIHPVVTDPKKAATALRWAVREMEKRYELFAGAGVKDLFRYNQTIAESTDPDRPALLPQVVILIDELADLMMVAPADVEDAICRLAQMARAAGMHLVVATQRPSVDVITGIIKANIPSRIAFAVSSQVDSRTILDMGGAERLLGRGDMLYYPTGLPKPIRVQGAYVSDQEIDGLTQYLKKITEPPKYIEELVVDTENQGPEEGDLDSLLPEAARLFIESGQASISLLQRRLRIGYTRAARIIDQMEEQGIVGGYEGSKARSIRLTMQQYEERFGNRTGTN